MTHLPPTDPEKVPGPERLSLKPVELLALALLLLLSIALRVHAVGAQSVWIDEAYSLELATKNFPAIVAETARDNHPPLYYLLLAAWARIGPAGESWARMLSVILGVIMVAAFFAFCREISDGRTALTASALLAVSPLAVWHSQDARMYALMLTTVYLALLFFLRHLRVGSPVSLILFTLMLIGALYTHIYSLFALPAFAVHLLWAKERTTLIRRRRAAQALGVVLLSCIPWMFVVMTSATHEAGFYKPIGLFSLPYTLFAFSVGYSLGPSVADLHRSWQVPALLPHLGVVVLTAFAFGVALVAGLVSLPSRLGRHGLLVVSLLTFPVLLPMGVTLFTRVDFNARYAILAFPAYLIVVATGLLSLRRTALRLLLGSVMFLLMLASLFNHYTNAAYSKEDARSAYRLVEESWKPGDCVFVIGVHSAFRYYSQASTIHGRWVDFRSSNRAAAAEKTIEASSRECGRVWFVSGREWEDDPQGLAVPTLRKFFETTSERTVPGIHVLEMHPRRSSASWHHGESDPAGMQEFQDCSLNCASEIVPCYDRVCRPA